MKKHTSVPIMAIKVKVKAYPDFCSMKRIGEFLLPPGLLVHRRITPSITFAGTHLYTLVERGTVRVKCLAQEHNTMSPTWARTQTDRSGVERTNHDATVPHNQYERMSKIFSVLLPVRRSQSISSALSAQSLPLSHFQSSGMQSMTTWLSRHSNWLSRHFTATINKEKKSHINYSRQSLT